MQMQRGKSAFDVPRLSLDPRFLVAITKAVVKEGLADAGGVAPVFD